MWYLNLLVWVKSLKAAEIDIFLKYNSFWNKNEYLNEQDLIGDMFFDNPLQTRSFHNEPIWTSTIFSTTNTKDIKFDEMLLSNKRPQVDYNLLDHSEKLMFDILNYQGENLHLHSRFIIEIISNVLINIFNPIRYKWASDYVRYARSKNETNYFIDNLNYNIIKLITDEYSNEWTFSKILCSDESTVFQIEIMFNTLKNEDLEPKDHTILIYKYIMERMRNINLFVVHLEIHKILKTMPKNGSLFCEICGISTFLFSKLSTVEIYTILNYHSINLGQQECIEILKVYRGTLILYFVVRLVKEKMPLSSSISHKITYLLCTCLVRYTEEDPYILIKAFRCIVQIKNLLLQTTITKRSLDTFKQLRCFILPMAIYSAEYINNLYEMLLKGEIVSNPKKRRVLETIEEFFDLSMFLNLD